MNWVPAKLSTAAALFLTALLIAPPIAQSQPAAADTALTRETYADGRLRALGRYRDGQRDSLWVFFYPDSTLSARQWYRAGQLHGPTEGFDFEGRRHTIEQWADGLLTDSAVYFHPNGQVHRTGHYRAGVYEGQWLTYSARDVLVQRGHYRQGVPEGKWEFFYPDGTRKQEGSYRAGQEYGRWRLYHPNGQLSAEGDYVDGQPAGRWRYYNKKGKLRREEIREVRGAEGALLKVH